MKKKFLSLIMCICIIFGGLFSFAGCSIIKDNKTGTENTIILTVDGETIDQNSLIGNFYTFLYSNYSLVYGGTDSSVIEEKFYNDVVKNKIIMMESLKALENGTIKYCEEDERDVWENIESYFRGQVETYEKEIYDNDESKYPVWLKAAEAPEDKESFEKYEDPSIKEDKDKGSEVEKLNEEQIEETKYQSVFDAIFKYVSYITIDENDNEVNHYESIEAQEGAESRRTAYAKYIESLFLNAKAEGRVATEKELLLEQIVEIYDSYYEAKVAELYQYYIEETLVLEADELKPESIVKLFLQTLEADKQNNKNEANYVSVITNGKNDDTKVVLYHNNDKFFTVQHILLKFDDALISDIAEEYLYVDMGSKDMQIEDFEQFVEKREDLVNNYYKNTGGLTDVNKEQLEKFPIIKGLLQSGVDYDYYKFVEGTGYEKTSAEDGKMMVTADQIIRIYEKTLAKVNQSVSSVVFYEGELEEQPEEFRHIVKAALTVKTAAVNAGKTESEIKKAVSEKVSSMVFYTLSWIFSDDGLYNTLYKQLGYVMANYPDDNNNFSHEFVGLSKDIFNAIKNGNSNIEDLFITDGNETSYNTVITKDGLHIIKVDNIFEEGASLIDVSGIDVTDVDAVVELMKSTYVCNGSDQTIYDYYRDLIYNKLAGDGTTSGSYFDNYKNERLKKYLEEGKVSYQNKISYEQIMSLLYS